MDKANLLRFISMLLCVYLSAPVAASELDTEELRKQASQMFGAVSAATEEELNHPEAELGRALFWDTRLSASGDVACASCHFQENWGSDSRQFSTDARGQLTLQSQTVFHSQETNGQRWLADRESGKAQAFGSITGSMGFDERDELVAKLIEYDYEGWFKEVFADEENQAASAKNYAQALETYQRTLRTPSAFDDFLGGDDDALNKAQQQGLKRFIEVGCGSCHNGAILGGSMMQRFGLFADYWDHTGSPEPHDGLMTNTGDESDRYIFRVPHLRNVAHTGPYFHDGSVADLDDAVRIMAYLQLNQQLDDDEVAQIVAFLESLTGEIPANFSAPQGIPFSLPDGVSP